MAAGLPSGVRACLFDLDGVLTPTARLHAMAWKRMFDDYLRDRAGAEHGPFVPFDAVHDYDTYVDGKPRADGTRSFLASRGIQVPEGLANDPQDAESVNGLAARKDRIFMRLLDEAPLAAYDGSVRYVRAVRDAGLRTAVVSSSRHCRAVLASAGITELFDAIVGGVVAAEQQLAGKPAPDTYLAAARSLGVTAAEAAVFEDAVAGCQSGHAGAFGFVVGVDRTGHAAALRRGGADLVVTDLAELLEDA